jgi:phage-related protein
MHAELGQTLEGVRFRSVELVEDHRGDAFRAVYTVRVGDVAVLHAFQEKSKSGIATPQLDVELIEKRLKAALSRYGMSGRK